MAITAAALKMKNVEMLSGVNYERIGPQGDPLAPPALLALEAVLVLASADGRREVPLADYFTGYRHSPTTRMTVDGFTAP